MSKEFREKYKLWETNSFVHKFYDPDNKYTPLLKRGVPTDDVVILAEKEGEYLGYHNEHGNVALNEGLGLLLTLLIGTGGTAYAAANTYIGVGDTATAEVATQTGLAAPTNKYWVIMDGTFPSITAQTVKFKSTFPAGVASYAWLETTVVNATTDSGVNLMRKTGSWGTKGASDAYSMEIDITVA